VPHRLSLVRQLADLRREYTGETDSTLIPAAAAGARQLGRDDRTKIINILDHDYLTRLFGVNELPPPPTRIRQLLLADAEDPNQQELESGILTAAGRAVNYLHLRRPADLRHPAKIFRMVRPHEDELVPHLHPGVLGPLLLELLPRSAAVQRRLPAVGRGAGLCAGRRPTDGLAELDGQRPAAAHRRRTVCSCHQAPRTSTVRCCGARGCSATRSGGRRGPVAARPRRSSGRSSLPLAGSPSCCRTRCTACPATASDCATSTKAAPLAGAARPLGGTPASGHPTGVRRPRKPR
jgi:hypothetical protein